MTLTSDLPPPHTHTHTQAEEHNNNGEYSQAKSCASYSLGCNICSIVGYVIAGVGVVVLVIVYYTVGFTIVNSDRSCSVQCPYGYYTIGSTCYCYDY